MICLSDLLDKKRIIKVEASDKYGALEQMVKVMAKSPAVGKKDELIKAIWDRERVMSTGMGLGIAVPHAKIASVKDFVLAVGVCKEPIDFQAFDNEPVKIIVMIAGPDGHQDCYLKILARCAMILKNEENRKKILETNNPKEVIKLFDININGTH